MTNYNNVTNNITPNIPVNSILVSGGSSPITGITPVANAVVITSSGGVPSESTALPGGLTVPDPTTPTGIANKEYVDLNALNGTSVYAASAGSLGTVTQSGAGVGATLTNAGAQATFALDGINPPVGQNVLIKNTATGMTAANEGVYTLTNPGSNSTNWILTRATNFDTAAEINTTGLIVIQNGNTLKGTAWYNTATIVAVDTTAFNFAQFGSSLTKPAITQIVTQVFTSSGTYTPTAGMVYCIMECVGGGGGSGGSTAGAGTPGASGGGGGGGYARAVASAPTVGASQVVTIGAAGTAGSSGTNAGGNGGTTSIGTICSATGGNGSAGGTGTALITITPGGAGGSGNIGDFTVSGSTGGFGLQLSSTISVGGYGGNSIYGGIQQNAGGSATGVSGNQYGGGAAGCNPSSSNAAGAVGFKGFAVITEYLSV